MSPNIGCDSSRPTWYRDQRTLLDKMILLLDSLGLNQPFYFVADAYYASGKVVRGLLAQGNHLVTRVKSNSASGSSRPRESHPEPLTEPCLSLSTHTARATP